MISNVYTFVKEEDLKILIYCGMLLNILESATGGVRVSLFNHPPPPTGIDTQQADELVKYCMLHCYTTPFPPSLPPTATLREI